MLHLEIYNLHTKNAIVIPAYKSHTGFFGCYFLILKKDGRLHPILDLSHLNHALAEHPFKMITQKQILSHIHPGGWFVSDLKDVYFHVHLVPHLRQFLRFAFEGTSYI